MSIDEKLSSQSDVREQRRSLLASTRAEFFVYLDEVRGVPDMPPVLQTFYALQRTTVEFSRVAFNSLTPNGVACVLNTVNLILDDPQEIRIIPLLNLEFRCRTDAGYRDLRVPCINTENKSLVAFALPSGHRQTVKIGKVITSAYADIVEVFPELERLVNWLSEEVSREYTKKRLTTDGSQDRFRYLISSEPKAFQYAYLEWLWSESNSCMADGNSDDASWSDIFDSYTYKISYNPHCRFYSEKINATKVQVKIAILADTVSGFVYARCLLWLVGTDENGNEIWYADRMYYDRKYYAEMLRDYLYDHKIIRYNKKIGCDCGKVYAITDVGNSSEIPMFIVDSWQIPVSLTGTFPVAYMDTFKHYYEHRVTASLSYLSPDTCGTTDDVQFGLLLTTTDKEMERLTCVRCGSSIFAATCNADDDSELDEVSSISGEILCSDCLDRRTAVCSDCGDRWNIEDGNSCGNYWYCDSCFPDHATHCSVCGDVVLLTEVEYNADGEAFCDNCYKAENEDEDADEDESVSESAPESVSESTSAHTVEREWQCVCCGRAVHLQELRLSDAGESLCLDCYERMLERSGDYDDDEAAIESVSALCDRCGERVLLSDLYRTEQGDDVCSDCYADADKFEDESESESEDTGKAGDLFSAAAEVSVTESGIESGIESVTSIACGDSAGCSARIASLFPAVV